MSAASIDMNTAAIITAALIECSDEMRQCAADMASILNDPEADDHEKAAAADTFMSILFPNGVEGDLDEWRGNEETEAELDAQEETFGERVRTLLDQHGWSQSRLAKEIGIGQPAVSQLINRECRPQWSTVEKIAEAFGVDPSEIWDE